MTRLLNTLVVMSLLATAGLGYTVYHQGRKLNRAETTMNENLRVAEAALDLKVATAEDRITQIAASAVAEIPDVDQVKDDLLSLEKRLFGFSLQGFEQDLLGDMQKDIASIDRSVGNLSFSLDSFKSCFNRALSASFASYDRAASSYYGSTYFVSKCY